MPAEPAPDISSQKAVPSGELQVYLATVYVPLVPGETVRDEVRVIRIRGLNPATGAIDVVLDKEWETLSGLLQVEVAQFLANNSYQWVGDRTFPFAFHYEASKAN